MKRGDIVLIPFPFADIPVRKVRPAIIINFTSDVHKDLIICAISSVVKDQLEDIEFVIEPSSENNLRVTSVVKPDRIVTVRRDQVINALGELSDKQFNTLKENLRSIFL